MPQNRVQSPIRTQRNRVGISQVELARRAGVNTRTVLRAENYQHKPSPAVLRCIASALGVDVDVLR
jgi:transcriptional regulator with XRE-family HTH domain